MQDAPCWNGMQVVLPHVELAPDAAGGWRASVILPIGDGGFAYANRHLVGWEKVVALLSAWEADPEMTLAAWWGRELGSVKGKQERTQVVDVEMDI